MHTVNSGFIAEDLSSEKSVTVGQKVFAWTSI